MSIYSTPPADSEPGVDPFLPGMWPEADRYDRPEGSQRRYEEPAGTSGDVTDYLDVDDPEYAISNPLGTLDEPPLAGNLFTDQDDFIAIPD